MGEEESEDEWEMVGNEEEEKKEERKAKMRTNDMSRSRRWGRVERGRGGNYWNVSVKRRNLPLVALGGDINILPPETPTCLPHPLWSPPFPTLNPQPSYLKRFFLNACSNVNVANITAHISSTTKKNTPYHSHRHAPQHSSIKIERFAHMQLKGVAFISFIDYWGSSAVMLRWSQLTTVVFDAVYLLNSIGFLCKIYYIMRYFPSEM